MSLVEIKNFNALIGSKTFFHQPLKNKQETYEKWSKCQEAMKHETY